MADKEQQLNEAMLCVFSALFADMQDDAAVSGDDVRRAMWPKGVPKFAEVIARNCCLALAGAVSGQLDAVRDRDGTIDEAVGDLGPVCSNLFERIGQALFFEMATDENGVIRED